MLVFLKIACKVVKTYFQVFNWDQQACKLIFLGHAVESYFSIFNKQNQRRVAVNAVLIANPSIVEAIYSPDIYSTTKVFGKFSPLNQKIILKPVKLNKKSETVKEEF